MVDHMTLVAVPRPEVAGEIDVDRAEIECTPTGPIEWRLLEPGEALPTLETIETLLWRATLALDELADIDFDQLDAETTEILVVGTEQVRRAADAAAVSVAGHVDRT